MQALLMFPKPRPVVAGLVSEPVLTACASVGGPKMVNHAFNFDGWNDGWQPTVELLEYAYGDQYAQVRRKAQDGYSAGVTAGVNGAMPVGEFLYVKWRLKASGEVLEERVDLRDRLPRDMTDHELTFVLDGKQLYVFVVTPERKQVPYLGNTGAQDVAINSPRLTKSFPLNRSAEVLVWQPPIVRDLTPPRRYPDCLSARQEMAERWRSRRGYPIHLLCRV